VADALEESDHGGDGVGAADRGQDVEGVLGEGELGVEDGSLGDRPEASTKRRASVTGTRVSWVPWTTKKGGA